MLPATRTILTSDLNGTNVSDAGVQLRVTDMPAAITSRTFGSLALMGAKGGAGARVSPVDVAASPQQSIVQTPSPTPSKVPYVTHGFHFAESCSLRAQSFSNVMCKMPWLFRT